MIGGHLLSHPGHHLHSECEAHSHLQSVSEPHSGNSSALELVTTARLTHSYATMGLGAHSH